jgi:MoaA/NifB/PqqE/SkfB family radical SAM enzyme
MIYEPNRKLVIDASNKCSLQCPRCLREYYRINKIKVPGENITIDRFNKLIKYYNEFIEFSGLVSDPIMNPNLPKFLKILYENNIPSKVRTAATFKPRDLEWYRIAFDNNPDTMWVFGLDGLPHESHLYRKKQDGEKLFKIMQLATSMGINTVWQYIVFNYNENHIDEAHQLAKDNNMIFELNISSRWITDDPLKPTNKKYVKEF